VALAEYVVLNLKSSVKANSTAFIHIETAEPPV
jgi:hypothetical protein